MTFGLAKDKADGHPGAFRMHPKGGSLFRSQKSEVRDWFPGL